MAFFVVFLIVLGWFIFPWWLALILTYIGLHYEG
jgi:hypothetical protein